LPNVKLIFILRNPTDRAFSQYCKNLRNGRENLFFEEALSIEFERLNWEDKKTKGLKIFI